jgi:hypothetical protein
MKQPTATVPVRPALVGSGLFAGAAAVVLCGLLWFYGSLYPLHHDLAGSVLGGRLAVTLGKAYSDYGIYFPPAERVWFSLAVRLGDLTGLGPDRATVALTGAAVVVGAGLAWRIRSLAVGATPLFLFGSFAVLIVVPILFKNVFGLREHLVAAGLWPYLVLRVSDPEGTRIGWRLRALVGLWLGATLLFKYFYSVVVGLVELADAVMQRRPRLLFRIENLVSGAVVALYLILWLGIDPAQREAIAAMVNAIDGALVDPAASALRVAQHVVLAAAFALLLRVSRAPPRLIALAIVTILGTVIVAWMQARWFTHHLFPIAMAYAFWWWAAQGNLRRWGHAVMAAGLTYAIAGQFLSTFQYKEQVDEVDAAFRKAGQSVEGKRVGLLNLHPSPYNQFLASNDAIRWNVLVNIAYVTTELKPFDRPENEGKVSPPISLSDPGRRMLHDQMLRLWEDMPPDGLIVDRTSSWPLRHIAVDWQRAFANDKRFAAFMAHYRPVLVHDGAQMKFTYFVRAR